MRRSEFVVLLCVAATAGCSGDRAATRAASFVRGAQSVRIGVYTRGMGTKGRQIEMVCPDKVRIRSSTNAGVLEMVAVGNKAVARTEDGPWRGVPISLVKAPAICAGSPWAEGQEDLATLLEDMKALKISKLLRPPRNVAGIRCQDWEAKESGPDPRGAKPRVLLCLAVDDYRPMELNFPDGQQWSFSDWNDELAVELPARTGAP